ncbi:Uncharacterised protein [Salmonella bongori]|nr:Uncharacterised protein [Salmonella bongori]
MSGLPPQLCGAILRRGVHIEWEQRGSGELGTDSIALQVIVGIPAFFVIPQMPFNGFLARIGQRVIVRGFGLIACRSTGAGEGFLQFIQQER